MLILKTLSGSQVLAFAVELMYNPNNFKNVCWKAFKIFWGGIKLPSLGAQCLQQVSAVQAIGALVK